MKTLTRPRRHSFSLRPLQNKVNQLFDSVFRGTDDAEEAPASVWAPRMDVAESDDTYRLYIDLPGMSKNDVNITVEDNRLTIRGKREDETRPTGENAVRMERMFGAFYRTVELPTSVTEGNIKATFENGVLSVDLPKTEKSTPTKIPIS